jgi:hypothetical protein
MALAGDERGQDEGGGETHRNRDAITSPRVDRAVLQRTARIERR